ncbi:uncharacterized protein L969DRAFT_91493 [Mixia osmundae IAM 14324]|uniref:Uncharacterized protein n=1 Tax=Mixia osmundae (strain CBS 9802 / IAM 14324 / JCM 22182 / KY 12970) TaxID=764103 RepID=G7E0L3_MIXOS|nr:uncharacterized protein L969DRAFT_91493 [Mixia osmundae IAM 14324]KEI42027.1 hypothetical protein L969DRAFT_91493 [Mixia osmundae IAM 14324]GAA96373.1 hypothetical protein E5Q_03039 [Mixia osmundae IAM 14324]
MADQDSRMAFDPHTFRQPDFSVSIFIAGLTDQLIADAKNPSSSLDPQPFLQLFETTVDQLLPLRRQVASQTTSIEKAVAASERAYSLKVRELKDNFTAVSGSFGNLEKRISEVGSTAIRIGEQLESIDRLRKRASDARDVIQYYHDFSRGDTSRLDAMRKSGREGRAQAAVLIRRLSSVAREIEDIEGGEKTCDAIEKYCEAFEKEVLKLFDRYYRKGDPKMMAHCARTLLDFNGGLSCIQIYVNQHDFFISKDRIQDIGAITQSEMWDTLPDPNAPAPSAEPGLDDLYQEIRLTVTQEAQIIRAVFPDPPAVMQVFLQRVFAQVIQPFGEQLITTASMTSTLAFLRMLHFVHSRTIALVEDLKSNDFFKTTTDAASRYAITASGQTSDAAALTAPGTTALAAMLDQAVEEVFVQHLEGARYLDRESKSLTELYAGYLLRFANYHLSTHKTKTTNTLFDKLVSQMTAAAQSAHIGGHATTEEDQAMPDSPQQGSGEPIRGAKTLLKLSSLTNNFGTGSKTHSLEHFSPVEGELRLDVAETILKWHSEALGRMVELSPPAEVPKNALALMKVLAENIGRAYVETSLSTISTQVSDHESKMMPDLTHLSTLHTIDLILHLWQRYLAVAILPLAGGSVTVRREMASFQTHVGMRIEGKINEVLAHLIDGVVSWLAQMLSSKQKKSDFKPKNDDVAFSRVNTEPCIACTDYLALVLETTRGTLSGKNCETVLTEIGVSFHSLLLDHFKRYVVSAAGGLMLTKDLALYQDSIAAFGISTLSDRFDMLRQLGNVFIVRPEILKSYLSEGHLARIEPNLLRAYLTQRSDYSDFPQKTWNDIVGAEIADTTVGGFGRRIGERLNFDFKISDLSFSSLDQSSAFSRSKVFA